MRDLEQCRAEVFRRSEEKIRENKRMRRRALTLCVPLALCLVIGAAVWPAFAPAAKQAGNDPVAVTPNGQVWDQETEVQYGDGAKEAPQAGAVRIETVEAAELLRSLAPANDMDDNAGEAVVTANAGQNDGKAIGASDGAPDAADDRESRFILVTPEGEETYTLRGKVLTCETEDWQRVLTEEEETALRLVLSADGSR